ncbi:MAG TPA: DUF3152 domain-containing protein, partial [Candidatus Saccharimonadales bacterium]|nr:DUF3152 domain-containing protein [Candidatus Saccharimonadales bacterium]
YRQVRVHAQPRRAQRKRPTILLVFGGLIGLFALANLLLFAIYANKTYPGTKVMDTAIGSVAYDKLSATVDSLSLLPKTVQLTHGDTKATIQLDEAGVSKDTTRTIRSAKEQKSWLPVMNLFKQPVLEAPVRLDTAKLQAATDDLAKTFSAEPVNASLSIKGGSVVVTEGKDGYQLDRAAVDNRLVGALDAGRPYTADAPVTLQKPRITAANLADQKETVQAQLDTDITYRYNGKSKQATTEQKASWYEQTGTTFAPSKDAILRYIADTGSSLGIAIKDTTPLSDNTYQALTTRKSLNAQLTAVPVAKTFKYCTAVRGVATTELPVLRDKLRSTFTNSKGWSLNGTINFQPTTTGCDFTVWLAAAAQMPSFGAICDSMWSCRVGPNVVINYDRWQNASPAWNQYGGTLLEYRDMVINHETGHWLGFGHDACPGPGQQAPVMQQQSISLQGCTFSPWPSTSELTVLRGKLAI